MRRLALAAAAWALVALAGFGCNSGDDDFTLVEVDMSAAVPADLGTDQGPSEPDDAGARVTVSIGPGGKNAFAPQTVFIPAGGSVTWVWVTGVHGVVSDDSPAAFPASPTQDGGRYTVSFPTPGQYGYHCAVHGTMMSGVVVVE